MTRLGRQRALVWGASFLFVLGTHAAVALVLLVKAPAPIDGLPSDAITMDLAPEVSSAALAMPEPAGAKPGDLPASDSEAEAEGEMAPPAPDSPPPAVAELTPRPEVDPFPSVEVPNAAVVLPRADKTETAQTPDIKPPETKPEEIAKETRLTAASRAQDESAAAAGGGGRPSSAAMATWRNQLALQLERSKRYPAQAALGRKQGTALVRFSVDSSGRVVSRLLVRSSQTASLDEESLAMILRAQPLPQPPPGLPNPITVQVPVRFSFR